MAALGKFTVCLVYRIALALVAGAAASVAFTLLEPPVNAYQEAAASEIETAPVEIDGYQLFSLRGFSARPAQQRALEISGRIRDLAADQSFSEKNLRFIEVGEQVRILGADRLVMVITDADSGVEGVPRIVLAEFYTNRISAAIERYRKERTPRVLLLNSAYAGAATIVLAALLFIIVRASRYFERWVDDRYKAKITGVRIQSVQLVHVEKFWQAVHRSIHGLRVIAILLTCLFYGNYIGNLYPWTRPLAREGGTLLLDPLRTMGSSAIAAIPNLAFIAVLIFVLRYVLKLARLLFSGIENGTVNISGFDRDWAIPTYKIVRLLIIAFGVVVAYPYVPGASSDAFKGVSIFVGIVFSLGSTSAVANMVAGYMMTYRRAFKVGDRIKVLDIVGDVTEVRLQVTHLRSLKNEEVVIPNSQLLNSHVVNYSRLAKEPGLILHTTVGIGYETPWRQVEAMLLLAAERTAGLMKEPKPFVLQTRLGDFCITYEINAYSDRPQESAGLYSALHRNILDVFNEYGVQIMTPAYEADPETAKVVPKEAWFTAPGTGKEIGDLKFKTSKPETEP